MKVDCMIIVFVLFVYLQLTIALKLGTKDPKTFCDAIYDNVKTVLDQDEIWTGGQQKVLDTVNNLLKSTLSDEASIQTLELRKYRDDYLRTSAGNDEDNIDAIKTIQEFATQGELLVNKLAVAEAQKLQESYTNQINEIFDQQQPQRTQSKSDGDDNNDDFKTLMNLKMYAVRGNFMSLCILAVDGIHSEIQTTEDNIQRTLEIFENNKISGKNLPRSYERVVFPNVLGTLHKAFATLMEQHHEGGYEVYIVEYTNRVSKRLYIRVNRQISSALRIVQANVESLDVPQYNRNLETIQRAAQKQMKDIQQRIKVDFLDNLPTFVASQSSAEGLADLCQKQYDQFIDELNAIGESIVKSIIDIQESLVG